MINFADIPEEELGNIPSYCQQVMQRLIQNMELEGELDNNTCRLLSKAVVAIVAMNLLMSREEMQQFDMCGDEINRTGRISLRESLEIFNDEYSEDLCASGHTI